MKKTTLLGVLMVITMVVLAACGGGSSSKADGVKKMKATLVELKKDVDAGDAAKAKSGADKLENAWKTFEDGVKKDSPDVYAKVEDPLHAIEAGAGQSTLDKTTLNKAIDDLNAALDQIK